MGSILGIGAIIDFNHIDGVQPESIHNVQYLCSKISTKCVLKKLFGPKCN